MKKNLILISIVLCFVISCKYDKGPLPMVVEANCDSTILYSSTILPIIMTKCSASPGCHESGSINGDFTTYFDFGAKASSGKVNNRVFVTKDMPQPGSPTLSENEMTQLKCWITQGAPNN